MRVIVVLAATLAIAKSVEIYTCRETYWTAYKSSCFKTLHEWDSRTWSEARKFCKEHGGDLVKIPDEATNEFVKPKDFKWNYWTGLRASNTVGDFRWAVDNSEPTYTDWMSGQPNVTFEGLDCVGFTSNVSSSWRNLNCDDELPFICETPATMQNLSCRDDEMYYNGKCYKLFDDVAVNWYGARSKCSSLSNHGTHAHRLSIRDEATMEFVKSLAKEGKSYYIGLFSRGEDFRWTDQTTLGDYAPWAPGEPTLSKTAYNCVSLNAMNDWDWTVVSCNSLQLYAACEYTLGIPKSGSSF